MVGGAGATSAAVLYAAGPYGEGLGTDFRLRFRAITGDATAIPDEHYIAHIREEEGVTGTQPDEFATQLQTAGLDEADVWFLSTYANEAGLIINEAQTTELADRLIDCINQFSG